MSNPHGLLQRHEQEDIWYKSFYYFRMLIRCIWYNIMW